MMEVLEKLGVGLVIAFATSFITVRMALKRFKTESMWSKKLESYTKILEALHAVRFFHSEMLEEETGGMAWTDTYKKEISQKSHQATLELNKVADTGGLIVCEEAARVLKEVTKGPPPDWESMRPAQHYEYIANQSKDAIDRIHVIAKRDLEKR